MVKRFQIKISFFILNAHHEVIKWKLPTSRDFLPWRLVFDTSNMEAKRGKIIDGGEISVKPRSFVLLESHMRDDDVPDLHPDVLDRIEKFAGFLVEKKSGKGLKGADNESE